MKIWDCYSYVQSQRWWYTDDQRIALEGRDPGLCLDLTDGLYSNGKRSQVYYCTGGNTNQIWTTS